MKSCSKCKEVKELVLFCKDNRKKDGVASSCKLCHSKANKAARLLMTDEQRQHERNIANTPARKKVHRESVRNWNSKNKDRIRVLTDRYRFSEKGIVKRKEYRSSQSHKDSNAKYRRDNSVKIKAQRMVNKAIERGVLTRGVCETCGDARTHGHHIDYLEPMSVMWLCLSHHAEWHRNNGPGLNGG